MPPVGLEPIISAGERPQAYTLDCADPRTGEKILVYQKGPDPWTYTTVLISFPIFLLVYNTHHGRNE
jgi:hypothetical protein